MHSPLRPLHRSALRPLAGVAGLALVLGGAAACSSDEPSAAPEDASQEDFCQVYADIESDGGEDLDSVKEAVGRLVEVGTPDDIPDEARAGFETLGELVREADDETDLETLGEDLGPEVQGSFVAFLGYVTETCADELDLPTADDLGQLDPDLQE
ncbi:hypothetical protein NOK12_33500 [Nocardioides sp. OK12]|uniref:hypothetical protein n=1 Tax=Nocardioides sp. OK12 TaxID=2758661 RepID=UPI0021C3A27C|nr:hypothetical protein [Nocardioides sp. OK12]GHJ60832.1 hypothetical protein NOK12_33500 [Nocardioides sp. OK12]